MESKTLFFDIEILPRHFHTNFGADRSTLCSFGYKWAHQKKAHCIDLLEFPEDFESNPYKEEKLVRAAHKIMKEADRCIHHYGDKFDFPYMNTKFMKYGLSPVKDIALQDTWKGSKYKLKLSSNRLDNIAEYFDLARKADIPVETWFDVIRGQKTAMRTMSKYCAQDVEVLHDVYTKILSYLMPIKQHAGVDRYGLRTACPRCSELNTSKYGILTLVSGKYQKYRCNECAYTWRDTRMLKDE